MRRFMTAASLILLFATTNSFAALPCADLKAKIAEGLDAKKVSGYTLTIVAADATADGKVVGTCDGGKNKIVYVRGAAARPVASSTTTSPTPAKPAPKK